MKAKKDLLTLASLSGREIARLIELAAQIKRRPRRYAQTLKSKMIALVFQKPSTRTRVSFEAGIWQLGGMATYLGPDDVQVGKREPARDVARVLSRYVDGIVVRTFAHADAEAMAQHASVPVINGLSDATHPCQALSDFLTLRERFGRLKGLTLAYIGDGNNILHSLLHGAARLGVSVRWATPAGYEPSRAVAAQARAMAKATGAQLTAAASPAQAAEGADALYTDVWTSMGQEHERTKRLTAFRSYRIDAALLRRAKRGCVVMHCLPAHRDEEITEEVLESRQSVIFDQAENRLHMAKAILVTLLGGTGRGARGGGS